jgi:uncharacterized protein YqiB (DUF1249 family)
MFVETVEHRVRLVKPRSFAGLMTLYESNHVRLRQLLGNLRRLPESAISTSPRDLDLYLQVEERCRYTTELHMTYWFEEGGDATPDPDLRLRIYHDARLAEAVSCADSPRHVALRPVWRPASSAMQQRWNLNILLSKWLEFCLDNRHAFAPAATRS